MGARATVAVATLLIVLVGCGKGESALPPTELPSPTQGPTITLDQIFADLRAAGATAPVLAGALANGLATAGEVKGEANSAAAALRAGLTAGLVDNVHLTAVAALAGYRFGSGSPVAIAAAAALQANTTTLADVLAGAAPDERDAFVAAWDARSGALGAYARAAADGTAGEAARRAASATLVANAKTLGALFSDISDEVLSAAAVQRDFVGSATRITAVIDALGAGSADAVKRLRAADEQAGDLAGTLARGMGRSGKLGGDPATDAAALRSNLAGLFAEGAYLATFAGFVANTSPEGAAAPLAAAARDASDANAQSLATAVGGAIGRDRQAGFISLWRTYAEDLHAYLGAEGSARTSAGARLAAFPANAGSFLAEASKGTLAALDATAALGSAVQASILAVDALRSLRTVPVAAPPAVPAATGTPTTAPTPAATPDATPTATPKNSASATPSSTPTS
ncbi:MAG: hypothetical protein ACT4QG_09385 [Sporichthyaceae bacterium]